MEFLNDEHKIKFGELELVSELIKYCEREQKQKLMLLDSVISKVETVGLTEQETYEYEMLKIRSEFQRDKTYIKTVTSNIISWLIAYYNTLQDEIGNIVIKEGID